MCVYVRGVAKRYIATKYSSAFRVNIYICTYEAILTSMQSLDYWSAVFILRPTNVRIWHKAVFKVGPVAGP